MHRLKLTIDSTLRFFYFTILLCSTSLIAQAGSTSSFLEEDRYLWLEDSNDFRTQEWLEDQKQLFDQYIQSHSGRAELKQRLENLVNYESYSIPLQMGDHYFFMRRLPSEDQPVLYMQEGIDGKPRVLVDPNQIGKSRRVALSDYVPSPDSRYLAYGLAENGSDWITWRVLNLSTKENETDCLEKIKFFPVAWTPDSLGFYYSRLDQDEICRIYYHRLGTSQEMDHLVNQNFHDPEFFVSSFISSDHQFLMLNVMKGSSGSNTILYRELNDFNAPFKTIVPLDESNYSYLCTKDSHFYFWTNHNAPLGKVIAIDAATKTIREVIQEDAHALDRVVALKNGFVAAYSEHVISRLVLFDFEGQQLREICLPEMGAVTFLGMDWTPLELADDFFFSFTHFAQPPMVYRYLAESNQLQIFKKPATCFNPHDIITRQVFFSSKDGTKIPLFVVHRKDMQLSETHKTLLYGYGGFGVSVYPHYNPLNMAWIENGGIFALANIRGGAEYGESWHKEGMAKMKQNCFDDFIAAAEWLIAKGYTRPSQLAIKGESNGGLLTAACLNQRPELFGAAVVGVGVLDMLRFPLFTVGRFWMSEYGNPQNPEDFEVLRRYSPYHNVRKGIHYPSTLITTADHDDRVVPLHSYKYTAAMQEVQKEEGRIFLRVAKQAGHGAGKSISQRIEEGADILSFLQSELK